MYHRSLYNGLCDSSAASRMSKQVRTPCGTRWHTSRTDGLHAIHSRIFATFTGVRASAKNIHRGGNGLVRLWAQRPKRHGTGDKPLADAGRSFYVAQGKFWTRRTNLQEIAKHRSI